jgi:hypothetical protein
MTPRLAVVPQLEAELDRLYGAPLDDFVATRNELAARLRKAGQSDDADAVRALRKPSVAVWTVNQLARRHVDEVAELVASGKELRRAQEQALRGKGAADVRKATTDERAAVRGLTRLAEKLLAGEGRAATQATLERVAATLRAAAVDPEAASLLVAGRLPDEVEASGFGAVESLAPAPRKKQDEAGEARARREREQRLRTLRKRAEQLDRKAREAEAKAERAESAAAGARAVAQAARAAAESAGDDLAQAGGPE